MPDKTPKSNGFESEVSFSVQGIDCIACTPVFRRHLRSLNGVIEVKEFPMTNKVVVTFDETRLDRKALEGKIAEVGRKSGFVGIVLAR